MVKDIMIREGSEDRRRSQLVVFEPIKSTIIQFHIGYGCSLSLCTPHRIGIMVYKLVESMII